PPAGDRADEEQAVGPRGAGDQVLSRRVCAADALPAGDRHAHMTGVVIGDAGRCHTVLQHFYSRPRSPGAAAPRKGRAPAGSLDRAVEQSVPIRAQHERLLSVNEGWGVEHSTPAEQRREGTGLAPQADQRLFPDVAFDAFTRAGEPTRPVAG